MPVAYSLGHSSQGATIREVTLDHPWRWLSAGWRDLCEAPAGIMWGVLFAGGGFALFYALRQADMDYLMVPLGLGFTLVGPLAAVGFYEISRRRDMGGNASLGASMAGFRRNTEQVGLVGAFLMIAFLAWMRLAMLEFMLFFSGSPPTLDGLYNAIMLSEQGAGLLLLGTVTGAVIGLGVFAMTAIAVPMLIDRPDCDAMTAMLTSLEAMRRNWAPMLLWAFLIGLFTLAGLSLFLIGLVVTLPLIGHASWHAYRDLVGDGH
jgi:uncharacterized membrane protein